MKLKNFLIRILFHLGISKKLRHTGYLYQANCLKIDNTWRKYFPWDAGSGDKDYEHTNYGLTTNEGQIPQYGIFTVRAKLQSGHTDHLCAVWMLYIDRFYEELDFELIYSPTKKRECLYISSFINHVSSMFRDKQGNVVPELIKWQLRFSNRKLIDRLLHSFNNYSFEIRPGFVKWYIGDRLIAVQKLSIRRPLYFVLSNVDTSVATIQE